MHDLEHQNLVISTLNLSVQHHKLRTNVTVESTNGPAGTTKAPKGSVNLPDNQADEVLDTFPDSPWYPEEFERASPLIPGDVAMEPSEPVS